MSYSTFINPISSIYPSVFSGTAMTENETISFSYNPLNNYYNYYNPDNSSLNYLWENYSNFFSLLDSYKVIKEYENKHNKPSEKIYEEWKKGDIKYFDAEIDDWLTTYMQIKKFILNE